MKPPSPLSDTNAIRIHLAQRRLADFRNDFCPCRRCQSSQRALLTELLTLHRERNAERTQP